MYNDYILVLSRTYPAAACLHIGFLLPFVNLQRTLSRENRRQHIAAGTINREQEHPLDTFELQGRDHIELNKLLKLTGICPSGGSAKLMIADGQVTVDGQAELRKRCKIRSGQKVCCLERQITVTS